MFLVSVRSEAKTNKCTIAHVLACCIGGLAQHSYWQLLLLDYWRVAKQPVIPSTDSSAEGITEG